MNDTVFIIALILIFILGVFVLPNLLTRRAVSAVIRIFRQHNAIKIENALTVEELGLKPKSMAQRLFMSGLRDYKPHALQMLIGANIIRMTEDGKFYLSEQDLARSKFEK